MDGGKGGQPSGQPFYSLVAWARAVAPAGPPPFPLYSPTACTPCTHPLNIILVPPQASNILTIHLSFSQKHATAHGHYLRAALPAEHALLLVEWSGKGFQGERDLYAARAVLQYLCLENLADANAVLKLYKEAFAGSDAELDSPLMNFLSFCKFLSKI